MDESKIEQELIDAQAAVVTAREARIRRQTAVLHALDAGWSKYRIGAVLGVKGPTVDSIITAADRASNS